MIEDTAATVVAQYLIATGVVSKPGNNQAWPCYVNRQPTTPNDLVTVYDTAGKMDGRMMRSGKVSEFPGILVRLRAVSYDSGELMGMRIIQKLDAALAAVVIVTGGKQYKLDSIQRTTNLIPLGPEEGGSREIFTTNGLASYGENIP